MYIYDTEKLPYVEFGGEVKRQIRMVFSPDIGNAEGISIIVGTVPPGGVSEGHVHEDCDEFICFSIEGNVIIDGVKYHVPEGGFVFAPKGSRHECVNTSEDKDLQLVCIFKPALKPYGKYPELIAQTKQYLQKQM